VKYVILIHLIAPGTKVHGHIARYPVAKRKTFILKTRLPMEIIQKSERFSRLVTLIQSKYAGSHDSKPSTGFWNERAFS
jgi:hypothetical protein